MNDPRALTVVFFDIGNTLAARTAAGPLAVFAGTRDLLAVLHGVLGLRLGVITNLPPELSDQDLQQLLADAALLPFFDPQALITNHTAGVSKPDPAIYEFAAQRLGVAVSQCLFIGENPQEVAGALQAGMAALQKPFPAQPPH